MIRCDEIVYLSFNCLDQLEAHLGRVIYSDLGQDHQFQISHVKMGAKIKMHAITIMHIIIVTFRS